jgi:hypothetical protein
MSTEHTLPTSAAPGLWRQLGDAIRGSEADYTKISLNRAILLLAVPMMLELVMESTFAVVDIYFVGKLGASAVATVGLTETILFMLYAIGIGLAMGVTAVVARRIGEQQPADAARGQIHRCRRTQPSQTNHQSLRRAQSLLPVDIDERHEDVAAVAQQIGVIHRAAPRPRARHPQAPASRP